MPSYLTVPRPGTTPAPKFGAGFGSETRGRIMTDWEVVMGIIGWIVMGLIAGAVAKLILPGKQGGGWIITIILGIVGAFVGGFLGNLIFGLDISGFNFETFLTAVVGAIIVLLIYGLVTRGSRRA